MNRIQLGAYYCCCSLELPSFQVRLCDAGVKYSFNHNIRYSPFIQNDLQVMTYIFIWPEVVQ